MTSGTSSGCSFNMEEALEICSPTLKMPLCKHKTETSLFISRTKMNLGKKFLCYPYWKVDNCGYWKWVEEGCNSFEVGNSAMIEIEELKNRIKLVEKDEKRNSTFIGVECRRIKEAQKELIEEMGYIRSEIVNIKIEMERIRFGVDKLGRKVKGNAKWKLFATVICCLLLAYMLPSRDKKGLLSLP